MAPERRLFEEAEHVALYSSARPTVPDSLMEHIMDYYNRQALLQ
jgi:hypothetical protein